MNRHPNLLGNRTSSLTSDRNIPASQINTNTLTPNFPVLVPCYLNDVWVFAYLLPWWWLYFWVSKTIKRVWPATQRSDNLLGDIWTAINYQLYTPASSHLCRTLNLATICPRCYLNKSDNIGAFLWIQRFCGPAVKKKIGLTKKWFFVTLVI